MRCSEQREADSRLHVSNAIFLLESSCRRAFVRIQLGQRGAKGGFKVESNCILKVSWPSGVFSDLHLDCKWTEGGLRFRSESWHRNQRFASFGHGELAESCWGSEAKIGIVSCVNLAERLPLLFLALTRLSVRHFFFST